MKKVTIIKIDNYNYTLYDGNKMYIKNIEFYSNCAPKVNDVIYISDKILNENNLLAFTELFNDTIIESDDIIKIVSDKGNYFLQRIYG